MSELIEAPWTYEQVKCMNIWQEAGRYGLMHPFTCGKRGEPGHKEFADANNEYDWGILRATAEQWICPVCDYTQKFAHKFQTEPIPESYMNFQKQLMTEEEWQQLKKVLKME